MTQARRTRVNITLNFITDNDIARINDLFKALEEATEDLALALFRIDTCNDNEIGM